jgi:predicted enzyme related to lactoylglutathione lyase
MTTNIRGVGEFCWFNILTPEPQEAQAFFSKVLEWTYLQMPGVGVTVQVQGHPTGGLFDVVSPRTPNGTAPSLTGMVRVESAEATCERVRQLGGTVPEPPFDIGDKLRLGLCMDPEGAKFDLWEPKTATGSDVDNGAHGAPGWFQLVTADSRRAASFYAALFGWKPEAMAALGGYVNFYQGKKPIAGMMQLAGPAPHWAAFFTVRSAPEAEETARALGARVFLPLQTVPGIGRFVGLTSPQGVGFHVLERA